jgi:predicted DNA-binding transcriptional regulator YafY
MCTRVRVDTVAGTMGNDSGRGQQVVRQWAVLRALEGTRGGLTVEEISEIIGPQTATIRTLYRDLEVLQEVGFSLISEGGRWRVTDGGSKSMALPVRPTEVLALMFTEQLAAPLRSTELGESLHDLRERLRAMLTPIGREYVAEMAGTTLATFTAPGEYATTGPVIDAIHDAIHKEQLLRIGYTKPNEETVVRDIEPLTTWYHNARLYLVAWCRTKQAHRTFAVQRIDHATVLDETFTREEGFSTLKYIESGFGVYQEDTIHRVEVRFSKSVAHLPRERRYHATQRLRPLEDGGVIVSFSAAGLPEIASWLASFGAKVTPLRPPALVDQVRTLHQEALAALPAGS